MKRHSWFLGLACCLFVLTAALFASCGGGGGGGGGGIDETTVPNPPAGLVISSATTATIVLNWQDNSANEDGFKVEESIDSGATFTHLTTVNANVTEYIATSLTPTTRYDFRVKAFNSIGDSIFSNTVYTTTPSCDLHCPAPGEMPDGAPFEDYVIDGTNLWSGATTSWSWSVTGGNCDQMHQATVGKVSYTVSGEKTSTFIFRPVLSGDYTITVAIDTPDGRKTCSFIVHIGAPGLRVELCWDTSGSTDLDLHVHKPGTTTAWFGSSAAASNPDDCHYANCNAAAFAALSGVKADWGLANSNLTSCQNEPDGLTWGTIGSCHNPRLAIENTSTQAMPENINIDNPGNGQTFRVMVHYYSGSAATKPLVNIFCGGTLAGSFGYPDTLSGFSTGGGWGAGPMWRVADVTTQVNGGLTTGCTVTALHPPGSDTGYRVTNNDKSY